VRAFDEAGKPIATLCHGPWVLASAGLTSGRTMTSWPGIRDDLVNAGATWLDQVVVHDGNWISSRMKWLPRPSIRTAVGLLAALSVGLWATGRRAFA
jgi:protease I